MVTTTPPHGSHPPDSDLPSPGLPGLTTLVAMLLGSQEQLPQLRLGQAQSQNTFARHGISPLSPQTCQANPNLLWVAMATLSTITD